MFVDSRGDVKQSYDYTPYGVMHTLYTDADDRAVKLFTGNEFDDEGQDTENGGSGIQAYHFKFRTYDLEIGVWLSTDPAEQHHDSYLYASCNPVMRVDPDGRLDVITHYLIGGRHEAGGDFWRTSNPLVEWGWINHDGKEKLASAMHSENVRSVDKINEFFETHDRSEYGMTETEWEGFRQHALNDARHEYASPDQTAYSPLEAILYYSGKDGTGASESLAKYQDVSGGLAFVGSPMAAGIGGGILPFMPITGTLLITGAAIQEADYAWSLTNHYIENAVYEIQEEGLWTATGNAAWSEVKQTSIEAAAVPAITPMAAAMPLTTTVLTVRSIFRHVRHWFLQD